MKTVPSDVVSQRSWEPSLSVPGFPSPCTKLFQLKGPVGQSHSRSHAFLPRWAQARYLRAARHTGQGTMTILPNRSASGHC